MTKRARVRDTVETDLSAPEGTSVIRSRLVSLTPVYNNRRNGLASRGVAEKETTMAILLHVVLGHPTGGYHTDISATKKQRCMHRYLRMGRVPEVVS